MRHPAAMASAAEQNMRSPLLGVMTVLSYVAEPGACAILAPFELMLPLIVHAPPVEPAPAGDDGAAGTAGATGVEGAGAADVDAAALEPASSW